MSADNLARQFPQVLIDPSHVDCGSQVTTRGGDTGHETRPLISLALRPDDPPPGGELFAESFNRCFQSAPVELFAARLAALYWRANPHLSRQMILRRWPGLKPSRLVEAEKQLDALFAMGERKGGAS